jgi:hypothetical protein
LIDNLCHRMAEQGRKRVRAEAHEASQQFAAGTCRQATPDELMREITS